MNQFTKATILKNGQQRQFQQEQQEIGNNLIILVMIQIMVFQTRL